MSIYFSTHKKKKNFPFAMFGFTALMLWVGLIIYLWQTGFSINAFLTDGPAEDVQSLLGFALIISAFLMFFLNLGIAREIKAKFKFPLYIIQFLFLLTTAASGYFLTSLIFIDLLNYLYIISCIYYILLIIFFVIQHRVYSKYFSRIIMGLSSLPALPLLYCVVKFLTGSTVVFNSAAFSFDNIVLYALLSTMLLSIAVNSIYLSYINRRVY